MTPEDRRLILIIVVCTVVLFLSMVAIFSSIFSSFRRPEGLYYDLEGYLKYDQHLDVDKIAQELEDNNITVVEVNNDLYEWESVDMFGRKVQGFNNFSVVFFNYEISVNSSTYPLPKDSIYEENNGSIVVRVTGTVKNSIYDNGFEQSHEDHWVNLYIENLGTDETEVSQWEPIMEKELLKIKQIILEATNLAFTEEIISVQAENWD